MATNAFLLIDCLALIFMVYALANFWNEWRRSGNYRDRPVLQDPRIVGDAIATTPRVFPAPTNVNGVIPFPARYRQIHATPEQRKAAAAIQLRVIRKQKASRAAK